MNSLSISVRGTLMINLSVRLENHKGVEAGTVSFDTPLCSPSTSTWRDSLWPPTVCDQGCAAESRACH